VITLWIGAKIKPSRAWQCRKSQVTREKVEGGLRNGEKKFKVSNDATAGKIVLQVPNHGIGIAC